MAMRRIQGIFAVDRNHALARYSARQNRVSAAMPSRRSHAKTEKSLIGVGVYSAPQAARLIRAQPGEIRRWLGGYRQRPPLWEPQVPPTAKGELRLGFLDLMELRFVREFRQHGVSLQHIRQVLAKTRELIREEHPLSTRRFKTDGKDILAEVARETGDSALLNLRNEQWGMTATIEPSIVANVVFSDDDFAEAWWPLGRDRDVAVDPRREFGQPILDKEGVQTRVVALTVEAEKNIERAARVLGIPVAAANDALEFERALAA
jgi:hypothetical protein